MSLHRDQGRPSRVRKTAVIKMYVSKIESGRIEVKN